MLLQLEIVEILSLRRRSLKNRRSQKRT